MLALSGYDRHGAVPKLACSPGDGFGHTLSDPILDVLFDALLGDTDRMADRRRLAAAMRHDDHARQPEQHSAAILAVIGARA